MVSHSRLPSFTASTNKSFASGLNLLMTCVFSFISVQKLCNFIEITLCHGCSHVNLPDIFRKPLPKNTPGRCFCLFLYLYIFVVADVFEARRRISVIYKRVTKKKAKVITVTKNFLVLLLELPTRFIILIL